jgi:hypothetical protein
MVCCLRKERMVLSGLVRYSPDWWGGGGVNILAAESWYTAK